MILSAVLLLPKASAADSNNIPFGYQSSQSSSLMTGSTYAASAAYDPVTSILYVVGASYESSLAFTEARAEVEEELETVRDGGGQSGDDEEEGSSAAAAAAAVSETQQQQQPQQPRPSDCYLTALALPSNPTGASGILTKSLGESGVAEACTAVTLLSSSFSGTSEPSAAAASTVEDGNNNDNSNNDNVETSHLVVLGHTAPDGLLTDLRSVGSDKSTTYGYALDLTISATLPDGGIKIDDVTGEVTQRTSIEFGTKLLGGRLFHEDEISYPLAATIPPARLMGGGEDEEEEGDEMIPNGAGPEFVYVLLQTSDVDPTNVGVANNFGFGSPPADDEDQGDDGQDGSAVQGGDNRSSGSSSSSPSSSEEEEQDPTVPTNGGTSLTVKKVALTSTTPSRVKYDSNAADDNNDSASTGQTNSMVGQTMIDQWTQQYAPLDGTSVSASDLLYVPRTVTTKTETQTKVTKADVLLLAGSTRGFGPSFGQSNADGTYDTDGFVTLLDPDTGLVVDLNANNANGRNSAVNPLFSSSQGNKKSSLRIRSTFDGHDVIHGLCIDTKTDNVDSVYIVGSTTGTLTRPRSKATTAVDGSLEIETPSRDEMLGSTPRRRAFVMKLNLEDGLSTEWVREYRSEFGRKSSSGGGDGDGTDAYATGCAVSSDDGAVYVGGVVTDGGRITGDGVGRHRHFSSGGDDIFIVRVASDSGSAEWARQIGSRGDDRLASRGGVILDNDGGAILVGTTSGSLMRSRDGDADTSSMDAFVMSVSKLGEAVTPVDPAVRGYASTDGECYFVSDPILYLVIVSAVSALCAFLLGHALRQRQALSKIIHRYSTQGREIKGVVVKLNKSRCLDVASRFVLVQYLIPSSSGGRLNKRIDNLSKRTHRNLSVGCLVNLHVIPGHDKSGVALHELKISLRRLWREVIVICFLLLASFAMSLLFATCLPWYGWVIAIVPPIVTASLAWLLWRNAHPNMELVFVHGEGCVPAGRAEESAVDECEWTDNDQTDDDTSSPNTGIDTFNSDVV